MHGGFRATIKWLVEVHRVKPTTPEAQAALKELHLRKAIEEYEYIGGRRCTWIRLRRRNYLPGLEYDKSSVSPRAVAKGTLDFDCHNAQSAVELSVSGEPRVHSCVL